MVAEFDWVPDPQSVNRHPEQDEPQKDVQIDFGDVHGAPIAVNKFTTGETKSEIDISTLRYRYL